MSSEKKVDNKLEEKVKNLLTAKLQNPEFKNNLTTEELNAIDKLFEMFPDLKALHFPGYNNDTSKDNEIILDEIKINNITYYTDKNGGIWNTNAELVGVIKDKNNYHFFDKKYNLEKDINFFINK